MSGTTQESSFKNLDNVHEGLKVSNPLGIQEIKKK